MCTLADVHVEIKANKPRSVAGTLRASADYRYRVIYRFVFAKRDAVAPVSRKMLPVLSHGAGLNFCPIENVDRLIRGGAVQAERAARMCAFVHEMARLSKITIQ